MAKKLSKSIGEYLDANGWSSKKFVDHAKHAFDNLKAEIEVGRSVIYIRSAEKMIKAYVHHNGRTNEYVTFTNEHGKELLTVHCSIDPADFTASIQLLIS